MTMAKSTALPYGQNPYALCPQSKSSSLMKIAAVGDDWTVSSSTIAGCLICRIIACLRDASHENERFRYISARNFLGGHLSDLVNPKPRSGPS